jgi:hypothetical protein
VWRDPFRACATMLMASCVFAGGCAPLLRPMQYRQLTWNGASAVMELHRPDQGYARVWIDVEKVERELAVRMPDGQLLRMSEIRPSMIAPYATPALTEKATPTKLRLQVLFDQDGCTSVRGDLGGSIVFDFEEDRLISVALGSNVRFPAKCRPALSDVDGSASYIMPVSETQLIELLGPVCSKQEYYGGL